MRSSFTPAAAIGADAAIVVDAAFTADIAIDGVGRCTVTERLNASGRPDIIASGTAERVR